MKLRIGDHAPALVLEALEGSRLDCRKPKGPVVLSFTRYVGCPVCQVHVGRIASAMPDFRARSCEVWMVFQSTPDRLRAAMAEWRPGFEAVADPSARLYDAFGVGTSTLGYVHPRTLMAAAKAVAAGKGHGAFEGRETQMPADFVLDETGGIRLAHYGHDVGDDAPVATLLAAVDSLKGAAGPR